LLNSPATDTDAPPSCSRGRAAQDEIGLKEWHVSLKAAHRESLDLMTTIAEKATKIYGTEIPLKYIGKRRQQLQQEASNSSAIANLEQKIIQKELQASSSSQPAASNATEPAANPASPPTRTKAAAAAPNSAGQRGRPSPTAPDQSAHRPHHRPHHPHRPHHHRHHHHHEHQAGALAGHHHHHHAGHHARPARQAATQPAAASSTCADQRASWRGQSAADRLADGAQAASSAPPVEPSLTESLAPVDGGQSEKGREVASRGAPPKVGQELGERQEENGTSGSAEEPDWRAGRLEEVKGAAARGRADEERSGGAEPRLGQRAAASAISSSSSGSCSSSEASDEASAELGQVASAGANTNTGQSAAAAKAAELAPNSIALGSGASRQPEEASARIKLAVSLENVSEQQEVLTDPSKRITSDNKEREQDLVAQYEKLNVTSRTSSSSIEEESAFPL